MLRLPDGVFFLGDSKLGSRLYVRPVYGPLFEALLTEKSVNSKRLFVITGTAGIGKSFFLLYALWRFAVMAAPPPPSFSSALWTHATVASRTCASGRARPSSFPCAWAAAQTSLWRSSRTRGRGRLAPAGASGLRRGAPGGRASPQGVGSP